MAQKHLGATRLLFVVTCALALVAGSSTPSWSKRERTCPTANTPTVTFVNHSGHRAHIKLLGPCRAEISVLNGQERTVSVSGGGYYTMTRLDEDRRVGSGFLNRLDRWSLCLTAARMAAEQERR